MFKYVEISIPPIASGKKITGSVINYFLGTYALMYLHAFGEKHFVCLMSIKYLYCIIVLY